MEVITKKRETGMGGCWGALLREKSESGMDGKVEATRGERGSEYWGHGEERKGMAM